MNTTDRKYTYSKNQPKKLLESIKSLDTHKALVIYRREDSGQQSQSEYENGIGCTFNSGIVLQQTPETKDYLRLKVAAKSDEVRNIALDKILEIIPLDDALGINSQDLNNQENNKSSSLKGFEFRIPHHEEYIGIFAHKNAAQAYICAKEYAGDDARIGLYLKKIHLIIDQKDTVAGTRIR